MVMIYCEVPTAVMPRTENLGSNMGFSSAQAAVHSCCVMFTS
nr:MAG TPA: hypothetical protein [Caudoviricetes sp.]